MRAPVVVFGLLALILGAYAAIPDQDWGYVDVRPNAHMFWWLYGKTDNVNRDSAPLVMWLQGGPGASSTGFGNFEEIGPVNVDGTPRARPWTNQANILFVDNPVGTGYSYVDDNSGYTTNEDQIAADLVTLMIAFVNKYPSFQTAPFFIAGESYGGKMISSFALALNDAINSGRIRCNFRAIAIGDSWINPMSFVNAWGPFLYATGEVDAIGYEKIMKAANATAAAVNAGHWNRATDLWGDCENVVEDVTFGVNFYNILDRSGDQLVAADASERRQLKYKITRHLKAFQSNSLSQLMNGPLKKKLGIPSSVTWGGQGGQVFTYLSGDFMQSVVPTVDTLLSRGINVFVYSGNLDLICCTTGTLDWMEQLKWPGYQYWKRAGMSTLNNDQGIAVGYEKSYKNLRMFTIFGAGHMVPTDQPEATEKMLKKILLA